MYQTEKKTRQNVGGNFFSNINLLDSNYHEQTFLAISGSGNTKNQDLGAGFDMKAERVE